MSLKRQKTTRHTNNVKVKARKILQRHKVTQGDYKDAKNDYEELRKGYRRTQKYEHKTNKWLSHKSYTKECKVIKKIIGDVLTDTSQLLRTGGLNL